MIGAFQERPVRREDLLRANGTSCSENLGLRTVRFLSRDSEPAQRHIERL
jgi:hypothetical protein